MINLDKFYKVLGDEGVEFFPAEVGNDVLNLYTGSRIDRIKLVRGYGVPLTDFEYRVFSNVQDAESFYRDNFGEVTSSGFALSDYGMRELA